MPARARPGRLLVRFRVGRLAEALRRDRDGGLMNAYFPLTSKGLPFGQTVTVPPAVNSLMTAEAHLP